MGGTGHSRLGWVGFVLDPDSGLDLAAERDAKRCVAGWGDFAERYEFAFKARLERDDLRPPSDLGDLLCELSGLGFPVRHVRGWTRGRWTGRDFYGFNALDATEAGSVYQLRFNATRLPRAYPDVVQHRLLDAESSLARTWHPRRDEYRIVAAPEPEPPAPRQASTTGRTMLGRFAAEALDRFFKPIPKQLHTDDPGFAAALARACHEGGTSVFAHSWAVKGPWLVTWKGDGVLGENLAKRAAFMDNHAALAQRLEDLD